MVPIIAWFVLLYVATDIAQCVPASESISTAANLTSTTTSPTTTVNSLVLACEIDGYKYHRNGGCYKFHRDSACPWDQAKLACEAEGGYLAVINDGDEARAFKSFFKSDKRAKWVGLFREGEEWKSVRGDQLADVFHRFQRRDIRYDCAVFSQLSRLVDVRCNENKDFICEKQL